MTKRHKVLLYTIDDVSDYARVRAEPWRAGPA